MSIALLITSFNRASLLSYSLQRISRLTVPDELVVVDDGSWDVTKEVIEQAEKDWGFKNVKYIYRHFPAYDSCAIARNIGLKAIESDYVLTSEPELFWVDDLIKYFKENESNNILVQGDLYNMERPTTVPTDMLNDPRETIEKWMLDGTLTLKQGWMSPYFGLYKKDWLMEIGGWDEKFAIVNGGGGWGYDDIDQITRLRATGHQVTNTPLAVVHQWHDRPMAKFDPDTNLRLMQGKCVDGNVLPENIVANQGREWGINICDNKEHEFCLTGLHCHTCQPERAMVNHNCVWGQK